MKYPPPHHQDPSKAHMLQVIKNYPLATVVSVAQNTPYITHIPLVYEGGKLVGHIDIYNPHTELLKDNRDVSLIFSGPDCYISPSVYASTQLPTWNYVKVHLKGQVTAISDKEALKQSLINMTAFLEGFEQRYVLEANNKRMEGALEYIKMFEIEIVEWEGKFKLSQDKSLRDQRLAREAIIMANTQDISPFLDTIYQPKGV